MTELDTRKLFDEIRRHKRMNPVAPPMRTVFNIQGNIDSALNVERSLT
jgi:hypothetical protein